MPQKLFGGKKTGRYSGEKTPAVPDTPETEFTESSQQDTASDLDLDQVLKSIPQDENQPEQPRNINLDDALSLPETLDEQDFPEKMLQTPLHSQQFEEDQDYPPLKEKKRSKVPAVLLALLLFIECSYCVVIFTDWIKPLANLRSIYIDTAMITMRHQWLATYLIPGDVVMEVVNRREAQKQAQMGVDSSWSDVEATEPVVVESPSSGFSKDAAASMLSQIAQDVGLNNDDERFFETFYELDEASVRAYADLHPEVIENGWDHFWVHEAGLDDDGTDMVTTQGDQILAIDAQNGLMVIRVTGSTYKGVLVIGKDPSRLKCAPSSKWGEEGEWIGEIAEAHNGLVGMTGSGFGDSSYVSEGADQSGAAMCSGENFGYHFRYGSNNKRIELHRDNRLYIVDAHTDYLPDCTDATEWTPALIVDGVNVAGEDYTYTALNPRTCLGQTRDESILMLGIEGRNWDSLGCNAVECAAILERYGAYQAMNVDGGTSSGVWYEGEYILRCSNENLVPEGRALPNAWVYCAETVPDP